MARPIFRSSACANWELAASHPCDTTAGPVATGVGDSSGAPGLPDGSTLEGVGTFIGTRWVSLSVYACPIQPVNCARPVPAAGARG
jgi:hypothetical protein